MLASTLRHAFRNPLNWSNVKNTSAPNLCAFARYYSAPCPPALPSDEQSPEKLFKATKLSTTHTLPEPKVQQLKELLAGTKKALEEIRSPTPPKPKMMTNPLNLLSRRLKGKFSKLENQVLSKLVHQYGRDWDRVSKEFGPTRLKHTLREHYTRCSEPQRFYWEPSPADSYANLSHEETQRGFYQETARLGAKTGPLTKREHDILMGLIRFYGTRWSILALIFSGRRTADQLRRHHLYYKKRGMQPFTNHTFEVELDVPEGMVKGDPTWTSRELYEMQKIINHHRRGFSVVASEVAKLFPGRTSDELNRMRKWVHTDSYGRWLRSSHRWTDQEIDMLKQFTSKYGTKWTALHHSRYMPGRSPMAMMHMHRKQSVQQ